MSALVELLQPYGAPSAAVVDLRAEPADRHVPYLDLLRQTRDRHTSEGHERPDGVVEVQGSPLAYVVDGTRESLPQETIRHLCKILALRDDAPYLTVVEPGRLIVYGVSLEEKPFADLQIQAISKADPLAQSTFPSLNLKPSLEEQEIGIETRIFRLLTASIEGLQRAGLQRDDAISLIGRALFTRFLIDRNILEPSHLSPLARANPTRPEHYLFKDPTSTAWICSWLDETFNGDFLPLSFEATESSFAKFSPSVFDHLADIMYGSRGGQMTLWRELDFA